MERPLPARWNRSRATALAAALILHALIGAWLLASRPAAPIERWRDTALAALPTLPRLAPPPPVEPLPATLDAIEPDVLVLSARAHESTADAPDWMGEARSVAGAIGEGPKYRPFGEMPKAPAGRPKEEFPPSIYEKPLPRVGTTTTSPEGETVLWVSDNCYIPLESQSLTMQDFHKARQGIRRCQIGLGKRKPRGDLFDHLKRAKPDPLAKPEPSP